MDLPTLGRAAALRKNRRKQKQQDDKLTLGDLPELTPDEEDSLMARAGRGAMSGLQWFGETLDKPGRAVRGLLAGRPGELANLIPFSDSLGITDPEQSVSGRELITGSKENPSGIDTEDVAGFGAELALDPLNWVSFGGAGALKGAMKAVTPIGKAAELASGARSLATLHTPDIAVPFSKAIFGRRIGLPIKELATLGSGDKYADAYRAAYYGKYSPIPKIRSVFSSIEGVGNTVDPKLQRAADMAREYEQAGVEKAAAQSIAISKLGREALQKYGELESQQFYGGQLKAKKADMVLDLASREQEVFKLARGRLRKLGANYDNLNDYLTHDVKQGADATTLNQDAVDILHKTYDDIVAKKYGMGQFGDQLTQSFDELRQEVANGAAAVEPPNRFFFQDALNDFIERKDGLSAQNIADKLKAAGYSPEIAGFQDSVNAFHDVANTLRDLYPRTLKELRALGINVPELNDFYSAYQHRRAVAKGPGPLAKWLNKRSVKTNGFSFQIARDDWLRNFPGGTAKINDFTRDEVLSGAYHNKDLAEQRLNEAVGLGEFEKPEYFRAPQPGTGEEAIFKAARDNGISYPRLYDQLRQQRSITAEQFKEYNQAHFDVLSPSARQHVKLAADAHDLIHNRDVRIDEIADSMTRQGHAVTPDELLAIWKGGRKKMPPLNDPKMLESAVNEIRAQDDAAKAAGDIEFPAGDHVDFHPEEFPDAAFNGNRLKWTLENAVYYAVKKYNLPAWWKDNELLWDNMKRRYPLKDSAAAADSYSKLSGFSDVTAQAWNAANPGVAPKPGYVFNGRIYVKTPGTTGSWVDIGDKVIRKNKAYEIAEHGTDGTYGYIKVKTKNGVKRVAPDEVYGVQDFTPVGAAKDYGMDWIHQASDADDFVDKLHQKYVLEQAALKPEEQWARGLDSEEFVNTLKSKDPELGAIPSLKHEDLLALVRRAATLPPEVRAEGLFNRGSVLDFLDYYKQSQRAKAGALTVHQMLAQPDIVMPQGSGGVNLYDAWTKRMKMHPDGLATFMANLTGTPIEQLQDAGKRLELLNKANTMEIPEYAANATYRTIRVYTDPEVHGALVNGLNRFNQWWRTWMTLPFLNFHTRNRLSGIVANWVGGAWSMKADKDARRLLSGEALEDLPDVLDEIHAHNVSGFGSGGVQQHRDLATGVMEPAEMPGVGTAKHVLSPFGDALRDVMAEPGLKGKAKRAVKEIPGFSMPPSSDSPDRITGAFLKAGMNMNDVVEWENRVGAYIHLRREGLEPSLAARKVKEIQFDYSQLSPFERKLKMAVPFYTYARKNFEQQAKLLMSEPGGTTARMVRMYDDLQDDSTSEEDYVPRQLREGFTLRWGGEPDKATFFASQGLMPFEEALQRWNPSQPIRTMERLAAQTTPLIQKPLELMTGRQLWSGRKLKDLYAAPTGNRDADFILSATPVGRLDSVTRGWRDVAEGRKSVGQAAFNTVLGGARFTTQDLPRQRLLETRDQVEGELSGDKDIAQFTDLYAKDLQSLMDRAAEGDSEALKKLQLFQKLKLNLKRLRESRDGITHAAKKKPRHKSPFKLA